MCGIFGVISQKVSFSDAETAKFERSLELISYRGPDDQSYKLLNDNKVFLGHRRLSIIDLSSHANQPMDCDGVWIVFNGEIFNFVELRQDLISKGHKFKTDSDTEVILKTYLEYGASGFNNFNGMWAFLLYDSKRNLFIASRDRFSIKPLYYLEQGAKIYFASEIKQLLPFLKSKEVNVNLIKTLLLQRIQDHNEETFFKGIFKVPPKHNFTINLNDGTKSFHKYWDYKIIDIYSEADAFDNFLTLFEQSIKIRLRSDVPIGCLLSGGLDSSAIALTSARINPSPIQTFSVVSDDPLTSEEKFIDIVVKEGKLLNSKLMFKPDMALQNLDRCLFHQDEPFSGASVIAQFMIYELIKKETGIKVVLSGQGGDEALMGYIKYFFFNIKNSLQSGKIINAGWEILNSLLKRTAITQFEWALAKRYSPVLQRNQKTIVNTSDFDSQAIWSFSSLNDRQRQDIDKFSVPALTHFEDRNSMAHSIESRVPFLDHELVNLLVSLPTNLKYKHGWSKFILRKSIADLPNEIKWRRDKKGFSLPERAWLNTVKDEVVGIDNYSIMSDLKIINESELDRRITKFYQGDKLIDPKEIFTVFVINKWLNNHFAG
jgi:asparagine synthase (glutamine-hydrolysing)